MQSDSHHAVAAGAAAATSPCSSPCLPPLGPLTWKLLLNPCPASACRSLALPALPAVYQASDYCDIMEHLIERWDVGHREGLRGDAAEAQVRAGCVGLGGGCWVNSSLLLQ